MRISDWSSDVCSSDLVTTWTLCTIPNVSGALGEMRRVLTPGGQLLFVEHGRSPDESVRRWQDRLTPAWKCICGGCHLNRALTDLIETAGFHFDHIATGYIQAPTPMPSLIDGRVNGRVKFGWSV